MQLTLCVQGYNSGGIPLLVVGVGKGAIGALGRPAVGLLECSSKTAHAVNTLSPRRNYARIKMAWTGIPGLSLGLNCFTCLCFVMQQ